MRPNGWSDPCHALDSTLTVLEAPLADVLDRMSAVLAELLPHRAVALLTRHCARQPVRLHGDRAVTDEISSAELARLAGAVTVGSPLCGEWVFAGTAHPVLAVASAPAGSSGAMLVIFLGPGAACTDAVSGLVQRMWDLVTVHLTGRMSTADPVPLAHNRVAASERSRAIGELTDAHSATLTALLGALRSRSLDDTTARRTATDIAVSALIDLRTTGELDRALSEEPAGDAFARLADKLRPLIHYSDVSLELVAPLDRERTLPADITTTARAVVVGIVLAMLVQGEVTRIRVSWHIVGAGLRATVRDDGPGTLVEESLGAHRLAERVTALGGTLTLDAVRSWGTTVTVDLPLSALPAPAEDPLTVLNPRELEVLEQLTSGRRNRQIAEHLHISERTVKFHVSNILNKLEVGSRGEAAAMARGA